ncbi:hypothetical protein [Bacillus tuaregi]|uniref:hypothetical protein n=1 Tax=Bacillus tuaregi TaxID=1816695 RepID=UPI0008F7EFF6|nr:hypothetical protein [Bacillus tuaregi]
MNLKTFLQLYEDFLLDGEKKGWTIEILIKEFGNYLASIKNQAGVEVQFFIELDLENSETVTQTMKQSNLNYGVIRQKGEGDAFAYEVLDSFHQYWAKHSLKRKTYFIYNKP